MSVRYVSTYGGVTGLLLGIIVVLIYDLPLIEGGFRVLTLGVCGAWMGAILAWLDQLLPQKESDESTETES